MKKTLLTFALAAASLSAFSQGQVSFSTDNTTGYVVTSSLADGVNSSAGTYALANNFTAQIWALSGPTSTTSGLTGLDAYGFLNPNNLVSDGFSLIKSVTGQTAGNINGGTANITGTTSGNTVLAIVCWTGAATSFNQALSTAGTYLGILTFVNPIGAASPSPTVTDIATGWNALANSPRCAAVGGITGSTQDLILTQVPEPSTMALAGLGMASMFLFRRRK